MRQRRGLLLAQLVVIAAECDRLDRAKGALSELEETARESQTKVLTAQLARGQAAMAAGEGRHDEAASHLRRALRAWSDVGSPVNLAEIRLCLCRNLMATGDREGAELELSSAESLCRDTGARGLLSQCESVRRVHFQ